MELRHIIKIFTKYKNTIYLAILVLMVFGFAFYLLQPKTYNVSLMVNITRTGQQQTDAYKYDGYYRLQADEKFGDTVSRWMAEPRILEDIKKESGAENLPSIKASRMSSQLISIKFKTDDVKTGEKISNAIVKVLQKQTEKLNEQQKEENWFAIQGSEPVIVQFQYGLIKILLGSLMLGTFVSFWVVLFRHYFEN